MKKIMLGISIIFVLLLTGCRSSQQEATDVLRENLEKDCKIYTTLESNSFGGGEFESHGIAEVGVCDGKIVTASATSVDNSLFSKEYEYQKSEFSFPTDTKVDNIFGDHLFAFYEGYEEEEDSIIMSLDLVVSENDLASLLTTIEEEFVPLIREEEKLSYVSIDIYTTTYSDIRRDDVIVGYLIFNSSRFDDNRSHYTYMNRLDKIAGSINNEIETIENLITDFNKSLIEFRIENNLL